MHVYIKTNTADFKKILNKKTKGQCSACDSHERYSDVGKNNDWALFKKV